SDAEIVLGMFGPPQWGIFAAAGEPLIIADSVLAVDYRREFRISDYPQEQGGFASYNKVQLPADVRVTFTKGGQEFEKAAFLASVDSALDSLDLCYVITPEMNYPNMNVVHYDYRRMARSGASLLIVDVWLEEVRPTASAQFTQAQAADSGTTGATTGSSASNGTTTPAIGEHAQAPDGDDPV